MEEKAKRDAQKRQVIIVAILNSKRPSEADFIFAASTGNAAARR